MSDVFSLSVLSVLGCAQATKAGGLMRYSALVIAGNGNGLVGYALAKGPEPAPATEKAFRYACKNLHYFNRFDVRARSSRFNCPGLCLCPLFTCLGPK